MDTCSIYSRYSNKPQQLKKQENYMQKKEQNNWIAESDGIVELVSAL